jgi:hypothetical protein
VIAEGANRTCNLEAGDDRRRAAELTAPHEHIGESHRRMGDVDGDLIGTGLGNGHVFQRQHVGGTKASDGDGAHVGATSFARSKACEGGCRVR